MFEFQPVELAVYTPSPGMGTGAAVADFDGDGDPDIFVPAGGGVPNLLFRNRGDGTFEEVAADLGLDDTRQARVALWVDYDGDGDLDLFVGRDCHVTDFDGISGQVRTAAGECNVPLLSLFEQRPDGFVDITNAVGLTESAGSLNGTYHTGGLSAADISGDGLPDIYFARWQTIPELYISDTLFIEGGEASGYSRGSGLTDIAEASAGYWQGLLHDFDRDGQIDLFVNIDFAANQLWINDADLNLVDVAFEAGVDSSWNEMGLAAGDYDNDGDIDVYITNIFDWNEQNSHNLLYRNDSVQGAAAFTERSAALGVGDTGWGWGATWLDADNDGDLDLAATNGYCQPEPDVCPDEFDDDVSRFFENPGDGSSFDEVGSAVSFDDTLTGGGLVAADFDGDGRLDLLQTAIDPATAPEPLERGARLTIYFNRAVDGAGTAPFVNVRPRIEGPNSHALGAMVRLFMDNGQTLTRLVAAGESWMSQSPATLHFGLGTAAAIERMEIDWPGDDADSVVEDIAINTVITVNGPETVFKSGYE
ncbi:MAG: CRTAC1 family protein [Wenzhouxiangellaceae bacterium]